MDEKKAITINIVNRNYPPRAGITGESAAELASFLIQKGVIVNVIYIDADYQKAGVPKKPIGNTFPIKTFYNGKSKVMRLLNSFYEGFALLRKSKSLKSDITICMTEPPLLNVCAALFFSKNKKWILWSMDLFPEGLSAGKLLSTNNIFYKWMDRIVTNKKPGHIISLGDYQIQYLKRKYGNEIGFTKLPCGIFPVDLNKNPVDPPSWSDDPSKIYLGYCGNIGEAHSVEFLRAVIDNLDHKKHKLILSLYGSKAQKVLDYAEGFSGIEIVKFVKRHELGFIDVHLASLKKEWVNVCVPSKTVSSVCSGSAFIYYGIEESDNWSLLDKAGWILPADEKDLDKKILDILRDIELSINEKKIAARKIALELNKLKESAFDEIYLKVRELTGEDHLR